MNETAFSDIDTVGAKFREGTLSALDLTNEMLSRADTHGASLGAFIVVTHDLARTAAMQADEALKAGRDFGPLHGIPVAVKDLFDLVGMPNTFGSLLYRNHISQENSTIVERLQSAGAVIVGKTNLHEFATGTTSVNPHYGPVRNPWDTACHAGGSSGGSAAAVAAGLAYGAIGTDTGASIRQPAHICGVVGLKPTFGRVSKYGGWPLSWSMDHAGPLTRTVRDAAYMLQAIAGFDFRDPGCVDKPVDNYLLDLEKGIEGLRIGVAREYFLDNCEPAVAEGFESALATLRDQGARLEDIALPDMHAARASGHTIIFSEFHSLYQAAAREHPDAFSAANRALAELGGLLSAKHLLLAQRARRYLTERTVAALNGFAAMVMPTCPIVSNPIDALTGREVVYHTQNTIPFDTISLPAISVPAGFDHNDRPFGLQIVGAPFDEAGVLRIARAFETGTRLFERRPPGF